MRSTSAALLLGCLAPAAVLGICPARADGDIYVRTPRPAPHRQLIEGRSASEEPGSSYGRPGNDFGPGYPAGASQAPIHGRSATRAISRARNLRADDDAAQATKFTTDLRGSARR